MKEKFLLYLQKKFQKYHPEDSSKLKTILIYTGLAFVGIFVLSTVIGLIIFVMLIMELPNIDDPQYFIQAESTIIYDKEGNELYTIHGDENRKLVAYEDISRYLPLATIAIEDDSFHDHGGFDIGGIVKAVCHEIVGNFGGFCPQRGGSTITQQLARNLFLDNSRSYKRKAKELILSTQIERNYSKEEIMELYLNTIPYGNNAYGAGSAARLYFGKTASGLTLAESTVLAALPNAPTRYSPYGDNRYSSLRINPETLVEQGRTIESEDDLRPSEIRRGLIGKLNNVGTDKEVYIRGRVDLILRRMKDLDMISEEEKGQAWEEAQHLEFQRYREPIKHPHFVFYVKEVLEKKYGREFVEQGGLKVYTTINPDMQKFAEEAVEKYGERNETGYGSKNAALVAIDPANGHIVSMVGSRDYFDTENDGNVNVAVQPRLPGSSFKPFSYAAAFLAGYAPATVAYDVQTSFSASYTPKNYDGTFKGPVTLRKALGHSLNIPAVKTAFLADIPNVIDLAKKVGFQFFSDESRFGSSLALGAAEVRLLDLVSAYSTFATNGVHREPVAILKIVDSNGAIVEEWQHTDPEPVIPPQLAYLITDVLADQSARGPGFNQYLQVRGHINAAKTGTANKKKGGLTVPSDAWTVGYTTKLVAGVWSGNNDGSPLYRDASGLYVAGPIWNHFMSNSLADVPSEAFVQPDGIRRIAVSATSGKLVSEHTPPEKRRTDIFADFNIPSQMDDSYREVEIDKFSGLLASEECPADAREKKFFFTPHSLKPNWPNWENPVLAWAEKKAAEGGDTTVGLPPTEKCTIDEDSPRKIKPEIEISRPKRTANVSPPAVGVWVDITTPNKVQFVEYYFDNELMDTATNYPFKGSIPIDTKLVNESKHTIIARVTDEYFNTAEDSIVVFIGQEIDEDDPEVRFIYPKSKQSFAAGSVVQVQVDAQDETSDVHSVELFVDGKLIEKQQNYPFNFSITMPDEEGELELKAIAEDKAQNTGETKRTIIVGASGPEPDAGGKIGLTQPTANTHFDKTDYIPFGLYIPEIYSGNIDKVEVYAVIDGKTQMVTSSSIQQASSSISLSIPPILPAGTVQLYGKIYLVGEEPKFSDRVQVFVDDI